MDNIIIYSTEDGEANVKLYANDGTVWMTQKSMSQLFECSTDNISLHLKNIFSDNELDKKAVTENSSVTATDGKTYQVTLYNLNAILAVGFRVRSKRGVQFRKWANTTLKEYMQKGFIIDSERLKNPDGRPDYFDELLEQIRDIRASEKRFYQKLKDLTLAYWRNSVNKLLVDHDIPLLNTPGQISHASMIELVNNTYTDFDIRRKKENAKLADLEDLKELEELISKHK